MSDPFSFPPPSAGGSGFTPAPGSSFGAPMGGGVTPCENGVRLGAYLVDILLMIVTCGIGWIIWDIVLWNQATSPAKKMFGLQVVDIRTGAPATMQQMLMRELLGKIILHTFTGGILGLISGILILVQPSRQGVWDYISSTTVVKKS